MFCFLSLCRVELMCHVSMFQELMCHGELICRVEIDDVYLSVMDQENAMWTKGVGSDKNILPIYAQDHAFKTDYFIW